MEDLATARQLNYLAYLVKGFEAPDGLTKKAASIMIGKALKEAKGSSKKDDGKKTEAKKRETVNKYGNRETSEIPCSSHKEASQPPNNRYIDKLQQH